MFERLLEWAAFALIGWLAKALIDSRKRLRFEASGWKFQYMHREKNTTTSNWFDKPFEQLDRDAKEGDMSRVRYLFTFRIFNEKSEATGLHKFSVMFTSGPRYRGNHSPSARRPS